MKAKFAAVVILVLFAFPVSQVFAQQSSGEKESSLTVTGSVKNTKGYYYYIYIVIKNDKNRTVFPARGKYQLLESRSKEEKENSVVIPLNNGVYTMYVYYSEDQTDYEARKIPVELYNHKEAKIHVHKTENNYADKMYNITKLDMDIGEDDTEAVAMILAYKDAVERDKARKEKFSGYFALTGSWYPYSEFIPSYKGDYATETDLDLNNFGLSALMNIKFFKDYGAALDMKIDDPTFKKLVDIAGRFNYKNLIIGLNYHSFGGNVKWLNDKTIPHPLNDEDYGFRTRWTTYTLMLDLAYGTWYAEPYDMIGGFGLSLLTFEIPLEHHLNGAVAVAPVKGTSWGLSFLLNYGGESPSAIKGFYKWIYINGMAGLTFFSKDVNTLKALKEETGYTGSVGDGKDWGLFARANMILGYNKMWYVGNTATLGFSFGVDFLVDWFLAAPELFMMSVGPAIRVSIRI